MIRAAVNVGLVGAGRWATQHHVPAIQANANADLVGFFEPDQDRAAQFAALHKRAQPFDSVDELLSRGAIDALIVAGPPATHYEAAAAALEAGIATLVEKPFTTDPRQGWELVALAPGVPLVVGLTHQFTEAATAVKTWLDSQLIGHIGTISGTYHAPRSHLYRQMDTAGQSPTIAARLDQPLHATFADPGLSGGGQIINQVTHILGAIVGTTTTPIAGVRGVVTIPALGQHPDRRAQPVEVTAACMLEATDGTPITISSHGASTQTHQHILFDGSEGSIEWDLATGTATLTEVCDAHAKTVTSAPAYPAGAPCELLIGLVVDPTGQNPAPGQLGAHLVDVVTTIYSAAASDSQASVPSPEESL